MAFKEANLVLGDGERKQKKSSYITIGVASKGPQYISKYSISVVLELWGGESGKNCLRKAP